MMNARIEKIAEMVKPGMVLADIGTDHAFLPILLIRKGICEKVYACDIGEGPLKQAEANIAREGLGDRIITVLSDGFDNVPDDAKAAVLAGMGYYTAAAILEKAMDRLPSFRQIIVEVNRNVREMRQWISDHHFTIEDEECIHDRDFDYIAISFTAGTHEPYSEKEILLGPVLMKKDSETYREYCRKQTGRLDIVIANTRNTEKKEEALKERERWQSIIECGR